jgi:hypothetical protein
MCVGVCLNAIVNEAKYHITTTTQQHINTKIERSPHKHLNTIVNTSPQSSPHQHITTIVTTPTHHHNRHHTNTSGRVLQKSGSV